MLRILLIILVALAVIIGLMRLTGSRPGDAAPAASTTDPVEEAADLAPQAEDLDLAEPATDTLNVPVDAEADTMMEALEPVAGEAEGEAPVESAPADPSTGNAAPSADRAPEAAATPDPNAPGR